MNKPYYFTFSNDGTQDYLGGHIIIYADSFENARMSYAAIYGATNRGTLGFAFQYTEESWIESGRKFGWGFNKYCHKIIGGGELCPKCGRTARLDALSRADNETRICSMCGTREALEAYIGTEV